MINRLMKIIAIKCSSIVSCIGLLRVLLCHW